MNQNKEESDTETEVEPMLTFFECPSLHSWYPPSKSYTFFMVNYLKFIFKCTEQPCLYLNEEHTCLCAVFLEFCPYRGLCVHLRNSALLSTS